MDTTSNQTEKSQNQKEIQAIIHPNGIGFAIWLTIASMLIPFISLMIPFCSYNPTILDETKRKVSFTDLSSIKWISIFLLLSSMVIIMLNLFAFAKNFKNDTDWRKRSGRRIVLAIVVVILLCAAAAITPDLCDSYEIPEDRFSGLKIEWETGLYLYIFGIALLAAGYLTFAVGLRLLATGKIKFERFANVKKIKVDSNSAVASAATETAPVSLTAKLNELQKLKDDGIITEEEYSAKKEELLKNYQ